MVNYEKIELDENLPVKLLYYYYDKQVDSKLKHWHRSIEIIIPIVGYTVLEELDHNQLHHIKIKEGDFYIINSQNIHSFDSKSRSQTYEGYALQIGYEYLSSLCNIDHYLFNQPNGKEKKELYQIIEEIISSYEHNDKYKSIKIRALVDGLVYLLLSNFAQENENYKESIKEKNKIRISKIINYINSHYDEEIIISDLASHFNYSRTHLARFFKESMGMSMKEYIIKIRLKHAIDDLMMTNYSIIDIAYNNGFPNIKSFNHYFKIMYQLAPSEYRKKHKK